MPKLRARAAAVAALLLFTGLELAGPNPAPAVSQPSETTRMSVTAAGAQIPGESDNPAINDNGNVVAFESFSDSVVVGDSNGLLDVFARNVSGASTALVSVTPGGTSGNGLSVHASVSDDGTKVAFTSQASDLVSGDRNGVDDIFVRDLVAGTTERVSVTDGELPANGGSQDAMISGDGTKVVFASTATNLVTGDTNGERDIFVRDLVAGTTTRINRGRNGLQANDASNHPTISDNGAVVAFDSFATNLVAGDTNGKTDVFSRVGTSPVKRLSTGTSGIQANGNSGGAVVRGDGSAVVFSSNASNLVTGDTNAAQDVFNIVLVTSAVTRVSVSTNGAQANGTSGTPTVSDDGGLIAFTTSATNLAGSDSNGAADVYVRDGRASTTSQVSVRNATAPANGSAFGTPALAGQTPIVAYGSFATNLVDGDTNALPDVFRSPALRCDRQRVTVDLNLGQSPSGASDVVRGTPLGETVSLGPGADRACMGAGNDVINGGAQGDRLFGNAGTDTLNGGADADFCDGGAAADAATGCETVTAIP